MPEYKIEVVREGKWWMVRIPELDGLTQARRLSEAETMAREWIALTGVPYGDITIETVSVRMDQRELLTGALEIRDVKARGRALDEQANGMVRDYCQWLITHNVPVRDIAELLDVSPQRISQLAASKR